jgi:adenylate cyclase
VSREQRKLAAIVATDVVGFARLMGRDESGTLAALRKHRSELIDPAILSHGGRIVKSLGDGLLLEFPSVVDATACSVAIQQGMGQRNAGLGEDERLVLRIGINVGDVIIEGDDLYGDGVNVAARLQELAEPAGIAISQRVHDEVRDRLEVRFEDAGEHTLKNVARPLRIWRWPNIALPASNDPSMPVPDQPSIAVLPFVNMSSEPDQDHLADGITEDLITALSRFRSLLVIARTSTFTYKDKAVPLQRVGRELGVRYVLEGSVRRAGNRVRITAQLIEAASGHHLWAERFDRQLDDIFTLQDEITGQIVSAIDIEVRDIEAKGSNKPMPGRTGVWEICHRGMQQFYKMTPQSRREARRLFEDAMVADPSFAMAYYGLASIIGAELALNLQTAKDAPTLVAEGLALAQKAVELDDHDALAHLQLGRFLSMSGDRELGISELTKALTLNPNLAFAHWQLAWSYRGEGRFADALRHIDLALRLSPRDPLLWAYYMFKGICHSRLGLHADGIGWTRRATEERPDQYWAWMNHAAALARADRIDEARRALDKARRLQPDLSIENIVAVQSRLSTKEVVDEVVEIMRRLGL